jgi:hypothetical protein
MKEGVQLSVLSDALRRYRKNGGRGFVRRAPVKYNFDDHVNDRKFIDWLILNSHKQYETSKYDLASSQIDCFCLPCFKNRGDDSSYFCSELVRDVLAKLGDEDFKMEIGEYADEFTPVDLSSGAYCFFCEPKIDLTDLGWKEEVEVRFRKYNLTKEKKSPPSSSVTVYLKLKNKD